MTDYFIASPLLFFQGGDTSACAVEGISNQRFEFLAGPVIDVVWFFLEPRTRPEALDAGLDQVAIDSAISAGLIVKRDDSRVPAALRWENHRWSRAAYLTFSQLDLDYKEPKAESTAIDELIDFRRQTIGQYLSQADYPALRLVDDASPISLSKTSPSLAVDLDAMIRRRSCRSFESTPISFEVFSHILHEATDFVRFASESKASGDPFFLLNSFYSWLNLFVVCQGVESIRRGVYQYDPIAHQLRAVSAGGDDQAIVECIQYQSWIGGGGFCVFVVVQWNRYMWLYRHSRAYLNLLIQLGEIGQQLIVAAGRRGLGGWMTPAITESKAANLLRLEPAIEDAMYFLKIGPPRLGTRRQ